METHAPVVDIITIRMLFALVAIMKFELDQMDVVTAFLYGDLDEDIYMEVPEELRDARRPELVCKLLKSLYGLMQAPRQWYATTIRSSLDLDLKSAKMILVCIPCVHHQNSFSLFCMLTKC